MASFNEQLFEKKLLALKDTQDSISSLSSWCLQQPNHHKKIVQIWLQVLKKVKIEQRLSLFYLANDVIQYSKRKGYDFVESWGTALQRATTMVRGDDKVRTKVLRLFTIWNERNIYDESFLVDLVGLLSSRTPAQASVPDAQDFQPSTLITKIRSCKTLEDDTDLKLKIVNDNHLQLSDADALRSALKDRRHGDDVVQEVEEGIEKMEAYIRALENEIKERQELVELLDLADVFYETQRGEARIVCNAYKNFGTRVKSLKRKLSELIPSLVSPIPSPDVNAPSPSPESDIELPDDFKQGLDNMGMTSFMDSVGNITDRSMIHSTPQNSQHLPHHHQNRLRSPTLEQVPIEIPNIHQPPPPPPPPRPIPPPHHQPPPLQHSFLSSLDTPYNRTDMPPLLGDGQDYPINGNDSYLSQSPRNHSPVPPFFGTGLSFIGNAEFQFDLQKQDPLQHNQSELDTPASPPPENLPDDSLSDELSSQNVSKEGKPIEVISSIKNDSNFNLNDFLKTFMPNTGNQSDRLNTTDRNERTINSINLESPLIDTSVPPPPIDEPFSEKLWHTNLPPKFPSWSDSQASWEDMNSPPEYKEDFVGNSLEDYEIPVNDNNSADEIPLPSIEIDRSNLISLTGSPVNHRNSGNRNNNPNKQWQQRDVDLRKSGPDNRDIVESVDMEMSDEEEPQGGVLTNIKLKPPPSIPISKAFNRRFSMDQPPPAIETLTGGPSQSISFNIQTSNKILAESPLKEREEPKKKLPLQRLTLSPPRSLAELTEIMPPPPPPLPLVQESSIADLLPDDADELVKHLSESDAEGNIPELETGVQKSPERDEIDSIDFGSKLDPPPPIPPDLNSPSPRLNNPISNNKINQNSGPRFPNPVPGLGFNDISDQRNNVSCPVLDERFSDDDPLEENEKDSDLEKDLTWMPPLNTPPPGIPPPTLPLPSLLQQPQGHKPFKQRGPHHGPAIWRGPRRGMPMRFRSPGGPPQPMQPPSPHMTHRTPPPGNMNFQRPLLSGPRPPFRGNNWRPRFNKW